MHPVARMRYSGIFFMDISRHLKAKRKLDFDDMILCCYELFSQRSGYPECLEKKICLHSGG